MANCRGHGDAREERTWARRFHSPLLTVTISVPVGQSHRPRRAVVVIQEIFGVNNHIRSVCDRVAELGHTAIAPQMFDRFDRDFESGYTPMKSPIAAVF